MTQAESSRYAIIRTGGKQYTVQPGKKVLVDKLEVEVGSSIKLAEVLFVSADQAAGAKTGAPLVENASVEAKVVGHTKGPKVIAFKMTNRTGFKKRRGHRQQFTELLIGSINC